MYRIYSALHLLAAISRARCVFVRIRGRVRVWSVSGVDDENGPAGFSTSTQQRRARRAIKRLSRKRRYGRRFWRWRHNHRYHPDYISVTMYTYMYVCVCVRIYILYLYIYIYIVVEHEHEHDVLHYYYYYCI